MDSREGRSSITLFSARNTLNHNMIRTIERGSSNMEGLESLTIYASMVQALFTPQYQGSTQETATKRILLINHTYFDLLQAEISINLTFAIIREGIRANNQLSHFGTLLQIESTFKPVHCWPLIDVVSEAILTNLNTLQRLHSIQFQFSHILETLISNPQFAQIHKPAPIHFRALFFITTLLLHRNHFN